MREFDGFKKTGTDNSIENLLEDHCNKYAIDPLDAVKLFPVLARRQWLKRFIAHTELFKQTLEVPGDIAELGVFRGLGLLTWANLLETFCIGDRTKTVYGFDNWKGFTELLPEDGSTVLSVQKTAGGFSPEKYFEELNSAIEIFDNDRFIPWKSRIKLVPGNIEDTVVAFVAENPGVRFSLVHFDCDLYKPTKAALEALWPLLSRGGIMMFDEYSIPDWPGETKAVDEFFADKPEVKIKTLPWTNAPAGYLVK
ncbi:MAG: macrocin-O-methyltransferase [Geobacter sp.]|nr:macrocin-O-methyltransferase [Geobacter sp.]